MLTLLPILLFGAAFAGDPLPETLQASVDAASHAGLPGDRLEAKAREGLAKNVPENRIAGVLAELLGSWEQAAVVLGPRAQQPDRAEVVPAAAAALRQGLAPDVVRSLASRDGAAEALWTVADVVYAGVSTEVAPDLVAAALDSTRPDIALRELPEAARLLVSQNGPDAAPVMITRVLSDGGTPLAAVPSDKGGPPEHSNVGGNDKSKAGGNDKSKGKAE